MSPFVLFLYERGRIGHIIRGCGSFQDHALDVHDIAFGTAVEEVKPNRVNTALPVGLAGQIDLQNVILSVRNETMTLNGIAGRCANISGTEEYVTYVIWGAVVGGDHVFDLNLLVGVSRKSIGIGDAHVGIVPRDLQDRCVLLGRETHLGAMGGTDVLAVCLLGQIQVGGNGIGYLDGLAILILVVDHGIVGDAAGLTVLVQALVGGEILVVRKGLADILQGSRSYEVAVLQGLKGSQYHGLQRGYVAAGIIHGRLCDLIFQEAACQEGVHVGHVQTNAEVSVLVGPGTPGLGVTLSEAEAAIVMIGGGAPEIQIVTVGHGIPRPGLGAVVQGEALQIADGVESGQLLGGVAVLPAREVHEAVIHLHAVIKEGIGVLHVRGGDGEAGSPVAGLGLDVDRVLFHNEVDDAGLTALEVTALDGVVAPGGAVVVAGLVLVVLHDAVVGLLKETSAVVLVDQTAQPRITVLLVLQIVDTAAHVEGDAQLEAVILDKEGLLGDLPLLGGQTRQREGRGTVHAGLDADGGELLPVLLGHKTRDQTRKVSRACLQVVVVLLGAVGDEHTEGLVRGVVHGKAVEGLLQTLVGKADGQLVGEGEDAPIRGGIARDGVGKACGGQDGGGAVLLGHDEVLGQRLRFRLGLRLGRIAVGNGLGGVRAYRLVSIGGVIVPRTGYGCPQHECREQAGKDALGRVLHGLRSFLFSSVSLMFFGSYLTARISPLSSISRKTGCSAPDALGEWKVRQSLSPARKIIPWPPSLVTRGSRWANSVPS